jgi:DNA polymerase III delta prime subunit
MSNIGKYLWGEKYRPTTLKDMLLPKSMNSLFTSIIKSGEIPHLLLFSTVPGCGKTTVAKCLCNDVGSNYLYINTSSDSGIDTLRTRITKFATTKSIYSNKPKTVILDEFDGATINLQQALRSPMEDLSDICRFILTCNYKNKIIIPLQSRCQVIDFNMTEKNIQSEMRVKIVKRLIGILTVEEATFDKDVVIKIVDTFFPDMRKMLNILQQYYNQNNKVIDNNIFNFECVENEFFDYILTYEFQKARQYIIESNHNIDDMYKALNDNLLKKIPKDKIPQVIVIIADYMYRNSFVIDKEINFAACMMEIISTLQS